MSISVTDMDKSSETFYTVTPCPLEFIFDGMDVSRDFINGGRYSDYLFKWLYMQSVFLNIQIVLSDYIMESLWWEIRITPPPLLTRRNPCYWPFRPSGKRW